MYLLYRKKVEFVQYDKTECEEYINKCTCAHLYKCNFIESLTF